MSRPEVTGRKVDDASVSRGRRQIRKVVDPPLAAYTIKEFCVAHRISEQLYFKLKRLGLQPRETYAGTRVLISIESAAEWRRPSQQQPISQQHEVA